MIETFWRVYFGDVSIMVTEEVKDDIYDACYPVVGKNPTLASLGADTVVIFEDIFGMEHVFRTQDWRGMWQSTKESRLAEHQHNAMLAEEEAEATGEEGSNETWK